jgi:hypothetical protein
MIREEAILDADLAAVAAIAKEKDSDVAVGVSRHGSGWESNPPGAAKRPLDGFEYRDTESTMRENDSTCSDGQEPLGVLLAFLERESPDLAAVVRAWATLPEAIKAGIVAMVKAAAGGASIVL